MASAAFASIGGALRAIAATRPGAIAVVTEPEGATSYAALDARVDAMAARLALAGVAPGERVAVLSRNALAVVDLLYGVARAGAIFVPINWRLAPPEIAFILADATPALLFVEERLLPAIGKIDGPRVLAIRADGTIPDLPIAATADALPWVSRDDPAMLVYTSGTTGHPKAAVLNHGSFVRHWGLAEAEEAHTRVFAADTIVLAHPLFHIGTIEPVFRVMFSGGTVILHADFDAGAILADAERHRATLLALVPTALQMVLRHPACATTDLSRVRMIYYGASPIPAPLLVEALERFAGVDFVQAYGMTEIGGTCVMLPPGDHQPGSPRLRAAGRPVFGAQAKVVGPDGQALGAGESGEIAVRGSGLMAGYWNRPEATAEAVDADGWLHTGDAGIIDADGYVYVQDRVKDMIISGGENIYPTEVESAVFSHPAVEEVVVVGVPDARWGEAVKALVVPRAGATIDEAEVIAWARERIAGYKAPRSIDVVAELPKSAAGKILRRVARAPYWAGHDRMVN